MVYQIKNDTSKEGNGMLKRFVSSYPVLFSIIVMGTVTLATEAGLATLFERAMGKQEAAYLAGILEQGICSILMVCLLKKLNLLKSGGFTKMKEWKQVWMIFPLVVLSALNAISSVGEGFVLDTSRPLLLVLFVLLFLAVGFVEEILFRSVILNVLMQKWADTKRGVYLSVIASSLIFGAIHLMNLIMGRYELLPALTQLAYALFFGVFFAACFLRTNTVWPVIVMHAIFDICGNLREISVNSSFGSLVQTTPQNSLLTILVTLPLFIYGLILLRKVGPMKPIVTV